MTGRWQALRWVERVAAVLVASFLAWYLIRNWAQVTAFEWSVDAPRLVLATVCLVLAYSGFVLVWRRLLRAFGAPLGVADAHRVWYVGNLARYVPGKVFQLAGTAYLARAKGVTPVVTVTSAIVAQLFVLCGAVVVAGVTLPDLTGSGADGVRTVGYLAAAACAAVTLTPVFGFLHRFTLYVTRRPDLHVPIPFSERLLALITTTACMALWGLSFSLFVTAVMEVPEGAFVPLIGVAAAGYLTAYVAVFVPAGLGVREGVFAVLLASYIPASVAIAVAILSRLWLIVVEIAVVAFLLARYGTADLRAGAPSTHG